MKADTFHVILSIFGRTYTFVAMCDAANHTFDKEKSEYATLLPLLFRSCFKGHLLILPLEKMSSRPFIWTNIEPCKEFEIKCPCRLALVDWLDKKRTILSTSERAWDCVPFFGPRSKGRLGAIDAE